MDVSATLIKLKENSQVAVDEWARTLNQRMDDVIATLNDEGVLLETWFQITLPDGEYLLVFMRELDPSRPRDIAKDSNHEIDTIHNAFKRETWIRGSQIAGRLLVDASRLQEPG